MRYVLCHFDVTDVVFLSVNAEARINFLGEDCADSDLLGMIFLAVVADQGG